MSSCPKSPFSRRDMSHRIAAKITGVAGYVPPKVMTNADFENIVETSDEWIRTRTGIRERHVVEKGMASSHLATEAAKALHAQTDRKSTRLNSSHEWISYAVFCLKKKKKKKTNKKKTQQK